jgi:hypothetical protein
MNKEKSSGTKQKHSSVHRVKKPQEIFYKNLDSSTDFNKGLQKGQQILTLFLAKDNGDKFTKFILSEIDKTHELIGIRFGEQVQDFFFNISEFYRSALANKGHGDPKILKNMIKLLEEQKK